SVAAEVARPARRRSPSEGSVQRFWPCLHYVADSLRYGSKYPRRTLVNRPDGGPNATLRHHMDTGDNVVNMRADTEVPQGDVDISQIGSLIGWTVPKLPDPQSADRWTWLLLIVHTQLRLARPLATDLRRPWEKPVPARATHPRTSPTRVSQNPHE